MASVMPIIAGAVLVSCSFAAAFMKIEISPTLMIMIVLGAVLVSLPAIRKFQLTKEGFVLERADVPGRVGHLTAPTSERTQTPAEVPRGATAIRPSAHIAAERLRWGLLTIGFLYATVSGVLSVLLETLTGGTTKVLFGSLSAPPLMPALCYAVALIALLLKFRAIEKLQLLLGIPFIVYFSWFAAFNLAVWLIAPSVAATPGYPDAVGGLAGGFVGALLVGLGLSIFIKALRSTTTISAIAVVGALAGLLIGVKNVDVGPLRIGADLYPLFIGWQAAVTLAIVVFMTSARNLALLVKARPAKRSP